MSCVLVVAMRPPATLAACQLHPQNTKFERVFVLHMVLSYKPQVKQNPPKTKQKTHNTQTKSNTTNINNSASAMKHEKHAAACSFM